MRYDAIGIGEKEISRGLDTVDSLAARHGLRILSNNIVDIETGDFRFEPHAIVQAGGLKVGITATLGGDAVVARTIKEREGIELLDMVEASTAALEKLRKQKPDLTVLIAHTGLVKGEGLVNGPLGEYDVILIGHGGKGFPEPKKLEGVILASPGSRSNNFGELTLVVEDGLIRTFEGRSYEMNQEDGPVDEWVKNLTWAHLELDEKGDRIKAKKGDEKPKSSKEIARAEPAGPPPVKRYLGSDTCRMCHADIFDSYKETPHSHAFQVIAESEEDWQNPECWNCHVLAWGEPTGHSTEELQPELWNVQCESCHGMGTEHVRGTTRTQVSENTCTSHCHVIEHSPEFAYDDYLPVVIHESSRPWN